MDIDLLKSSSAPEDQMDMIMMMQMMDKLPEFCGPHSIVGDQNSSKMEFHRSVHNMPQIIDNPHVISPSLINQPSSLSFSDAVPSVPSITEPTEQSFFTNSSSFSTSLQKKNSMTAMREMIFRIAAMQPIHIDPEAVKPPKRRNVKISKDPQSVAARHRRERISERIRILQRLVPGGTKMDTASMLDEAIHYVKFLKTQVQSLERAAANRPPPGGIGFPVAMSSGSYLEKINYQPAHHHHHHQNVHHQYSDA